MHFGNLGLILDPDFYNFVLKLSNTKESTSNIKRAFTASDVFFKNVYCVEVFRTIKFVQNKVAVKNLQRNTLLPTVKSYI